MADETPAQQAAAGLLEELEAYAEPEETTEATDEVEQPQDEVEVPEINWETPEELKDLLNAPDFDEDEEVEEFEGEGNVQPTFEDEYEDPEKERLRKQLLKAQKKLAWAEEQKAKQGRKLWADEARKYFQFSNPDLIEAKSRRSFLKEAQRQHEAVAKVAKPVFDQIADLKAKAREEALAEARAEAERRWGAPTTGPQANTTLQDTQSSSRERMQMGRGLKDVLKEKLVRGEVNL